MLRTPAPVARESDDTVGDQLLTVADVAAEVRFTPGYVYEAIRRGQLSAVRKGKYVRIRRAQLRAWLDGFPANPRGDKGWVDELAARRKRKSLAPKVGTKRGQRQMVIWKYLIWLEPGAGVEPATY